MGLFQRITDIVCANLNDMTDQFEDPEKMLKQAIREMETAINQATEETAKAMGSEKLLQKELSQNKEQAARWFEHAGQAVSAGDDDLARKALARKQEHDNLVAAIDDQLKVASESNKLLRRQLEGMKAKLAEAKRNLGSLLARKKAADFRKRTHTAALEVGVEFEEDAFQKFERLKQKVEQAEAQADALAELRGQSPSSECQIYANGGLEAQLNALRKSDTQPAPTSNQLEIEEQLQRMKKAKDVP